MKKFTFLLGFVLSGNVVLSQVFTIWNFGTTSGDANPSSNTVPNVNVSMVSHGNINGTNPLLTNMSPSMGYTGSSGDYNAGAAARTGALNTGTNGSAYFEFTLSPDVGYIASITAIKFGSRSTSTGPQDFCVRSSLNGYSSSYGTATDAANSVWILKTPTIAEITTASGIPVTIRIYGYNGTGNAVVSSVNWRIDDLEVTANVTAPGQPIITTSVSEISELVAVTNMPSNEVVYQVSGMNLNGNIDIDANVFDIPYPYQISLTSGSGFTTGDIALVPTNGTVPATNIYVRLNQTLVALGRIFGVIGHSSPGAASRTILMHGTVLATQPTTQSNMTIGSVTNATTTLNFNGGSGEKHIVLARAGGPPNSDPVDGTTYAANSIYRLGSQLGTGNYVVYVGPGNSVLVSGLTHNANYHYACYDFNDGDVPYAENYLITSPGTANATTTSEVNTFTFTGTTDNNYNVSANWLPERTYPATNDQIQFIGLGSPRLTNTITITEVPAQTIEGLKLSNNITVNLQAAGPGTTLTMGNGAGTDLDIPAGNQLNMNGTDDLTIALAAGATGSISGAMAFTNAGHRLTANDASGITFNNGSVFTAGTGFTGNSFGSTTPGSIVFANGSRYEQSSGGTPFGNTSNAVLLFQTSSLYKAMGNNFSPFFSTRTYSNVEFAGTGFSSMGGGGVTSLDNLTITSGNVSVNMTGSPGHSIKGNISVASGATLNFTPPSSGTFNLNGPAAQSIGNSGTLNFGPNQNLLINNNNGVTLNADVTLGTSGTFQFVNGKVTLGNNNLTANTVSGGSTSNYVKTNGTGALTVRNITTGAKTLAVGNSTYNPVTIANGSGHDWSARVIDDVIVTDPTFAANAAKAIKRTWEIAPSVNPPSAGATVTFQYNDGDASQIGASFSTSENVQAWRKTGTDWSRAGGAQTPTGTAGSTRTVTITNQSGFSPFAISNISGPLPVIFDNVKITHVSGGVKVEWSNMTETEVVNYNVERSADGRNFTSIVEVNARLNNGSRADYGLIDAAPFSGINFYRIKSLETSGKNKYSIIVKVDLRGGATQLVLYPNPISDGQISYQANNLVKGLYMVKVFISTGQQVYSKSLNHPGGSVSEAIIIPSTQPGVYSLQLISADNIFVKTFVMQ